MFEGKVLIPIDFSKTSEKLCESVTELKKLGINEVLLVHVIETGYTGINPHKLKKYYEERLFSLKMMIEPIIKRVAIKIQIGRSSKEILKLSKKENVDLILIASHGRGIIRDFFLGHTAYNVARGSQKPVLIEKFENIKKDENIKIARVNKFDKILVPTDFSKYADEVINKISTIPFQLEEIMLVSIIESDKDLIRQRMTVRENMEQIKEKLKRSSLCKQVKIITREGIASREIVNIAEEENAGIIIMATRGRGNIKKVVFGSTADRVTRRSPIPVLLFPLYNIE